jgi:predicted nuclease of predicted toxin-antitoxin system
MLGMETVPDREIWEYARVHDFTIVTQDGDFDQLSQVLGFPPKVIWLRMGNNPARRVLELLDRELPAIKHFMGHPNRSLLILEP